MIGGRSPQYLNTFSNLFYCVHTTHINTHCYCWRYLCIPRCPKYQNIPYLVAIVVCSHRVSYSFLRELSNFTQENTQADISIEDQLRPPLDMVTVDQKRELHKPNSWTSESHSSWYKSSAEVVLLHWIKKKSSHKCLLEHFEYFGTNIMMRGPVVRQFHVGRSRETNKETLDEFQVFISLRNIFFLQHFFGTAYLLP